MKRRTALATTAAALTTSLAGCGTVSASVRAPNVDSEKLDTGGWELLTEQEQTLLEREIGPETVTATGVTKLWEDAELRKQLNDDTGGRVNTQVAAFFASRIVSDPSLGTVPDEFSGQLENQISEIASSEFKNQMGERVDNISVSKTDETLTVATGDEISLREVSAEVDLPDIEYPVPNGEPVTVENGALDIAGYLAVWIDSGAVYVAGGVYPGENYVKTVEETLTDAITVTVDVDLGLEPSAYKQELLGLMKSVR